MNQLSNRAHKFWRILGPFTYIAVALAGVGLSFVSPVPVLLILTIPLGLAFIVKGLSLRSTKVVSMDESHLYIGEGIQRKISLNEIVEVTSSLGSPTVITLNFTQRSKGKNSVCFVASTAYPHRLFSDHPTVKNIKAARKALPHSK